MTAPRAAPAILALALLVLPALAPTAGAQVFVPEPLTGRGTLSKFQVFSNGHNVEGGLHERTILCRSCHIRLNVTEGDFQVFEAGALVTLDAGVVYELRGFVGTFAYTQEALGVFRVEIDGAGSVKRMG